MTIILGEQGDHVPVGERQFVGAVNPSPWAAVPWRTIAGAVAVVAGFALAALAAVALSRILLWMTIAGFIAILLAPIVRRLQPRLRGHRVLATTIVMVVTLSIVLGSVALFVLPIRRQIVQIAGDLPGTLHAAADGRGPVGRIVQRLHLDSWVRDHESELNSWAAGVSDSSLSIARSVFQATLATLTIFFMAFLFLTQSAVISRTALSMVPLRRRAMAQAVSVDAASAVSGYMVGNLLISAVAGIAAFLCLTVLGVPNAAVFALWVAFADLIPLIGATLGAAAAVLAAFLHTNTAGLVALAFFVVYQQFENSVLQTAVMSRTVKVNPIVVLVSVLVGVEMLGFAGAVLAIPLAGSLQVIMKAVRRESRRDRLVLPTESTYGRETGSADVSSKLT